MKTEETCASFYFINLDETVCLQSKKKEEWIRKIREERLQGIAKSMSSANRLAK